MESYFTETGHRPGDNKRKAPDGIGTGTTVIAVRTPRTNLVEIKGGSQCE
jgi:hypothetical protein